MKTIFTILLLLNLSTGFPQDPAGGRILSLSAYCADFADPFSQRSNPSILAGMKKRSAAAYTEQKFMISEWKTAVAAAVFPTAGGNFGLWTEYSGTENFTGLRSAVSYARSFGSNIDAGLQFHYYHAAIPGYRNSSAFGYTVSTLVHLTVKANAGINFSNEQQTEHAGKATEKLPDKFGFGLGYTVSKLVFLTAEITKASAIPVNISAGLHYAFDEKLFFRTAFSSATQTWQLAAGIKWKQLCFQFIGSMHPVLGITPGIAFLFEEKNNTK